MADRSPPRPRAVRLDQRQIQILNRLVDLPSILVADSNAINPGIPEREPHRRLAVLTVERAFAHKLHADYAHTVFADLLDVGDNFADISQSVGVEILRVHSGALVIHPDHGDVEPLVPGHLPQRREPVNRSAVTYDRLLRFRFENSILPPARIRWPSRGMLPVQQHHVEILGIREFAQLVDFILRIHTFPSGHLRHNPIAIARNALQSHSEHPVHVAIRLRGLEEANAAVIRITHQPRKLLLPQVPLHSPAETPRAKRESRHFHLRFSERHPIRRSLALRSQWEASGHGKRPGGESGLEEFTSGVARHQSTSKSEMVPRVTGSGDGRSAGPAYLFAPRGADPMHGSSCTSYPRCHGFFRYSWC